MADLLMLLMQPSLKWSRYLHFLELKGLWPLETSPRPFYGFIR
jgi:hypothetical protein